MGLGEEEVEKVYSTTALKNLLKYLKGYEKQCVLGPLFKLLEATFELLVPLVVARIVDQGIGTGNTGYIVKR